MPILTGLVANFRKQTMAAYSVEIWFTPSGPGVGATGGMIAAQPVIVVPDPDGTFSIDLQQTATLRPTVWFDISLRYLDAAGNYIARDDIPGRLDVGTLGGVLTDFISSTNQPIPGHLVEWGPTAPDPWPIGLVWADTSTGDIKRKTA